MPASNVIPIPKRKNKAVHRQMGSLGSSAGSSPCPRTPSRGFAEASSYGSYESNASLMTDGTPETTRQSREALMSPSFSHAEHTVVEVGGDGELEVRLITCVKASQGFSWNLDIFLPSYLTHLHNERDLERRPDPVMDIVLHGAEEARVPL